MTKLCVFPNDPLRSYFEKGEIKERYFNPNNLFDKIHVISFCNEDIEEEKVSIVAGDAKLIIHPVGSVNLKNMKERAKEVIKIVSKISPDVIRTYDPLIQGWIATKCSNELDIPIVVSLHGEYDQFRNMVKKQNFKKYLKLVYTSKFIEPYVIKNANRVICVYKVIIPYAKKKGATKIDLIYNRVDLTKFNEKVNTIKNEIPIIITVGRLIKQKNHEIILNAIKPLNVQLWIIGDGEDYGRLQKIIRKLNIGKKVIFKRSIPHLEMHHWYKKADIFVLAMRTDLESLPIPILEAMASGLPVIIPKPKSPELIDEMGDGVIRIENKPQFFTEAIEKILNNSDLHDKLTKKVLEDIQNFDGKIMEEKETELYKEVILAKK